MNAKELGLEEWERAEIKRSQSEASRWSSIDLRADAGNLARYVAPPEDTCFDLEYAFHLLGDVRGKKVLEVGCGSGENTILLAQRGAHVLSTDISAPLIEVARRRLEINGMHRNVEFFAGSAHDLPLADNSIDVVVGIAVLHHLELPLAAREVRRVLRPGGRAIFQEPLRNSKTISFIRNLIPYRAPDVSPFERPLTDAELNAFSEGFRHTRSNVFVTPLLRAGKLLPVIRNYWRTLYRWDHAMLNSVPFMKYYATVRVFEIVK